jgi:DNA repair exonuclease SbcCD nuclease subunit
VFTIAVAHGQADAGSLAAHKHIDYWALGGRHQTKTLFQAQQTGHYPGTPQGRCPEEEGTHGCTLVQVEPGRKVRTKFIATDVVRWRTESLPAAENTNRNDLQRQLRAGMQRIASEASGGAVLVSWTVQADGSLVRGLRRGGLGQDLIEWLRTEFGRAKPPVWTLALQAATADSVSEELYEEDTILGDFLRAVREHEQDASRALNFSAYLPDLSKNRPLELALQSVDSEARRVLLREAAMLGVDLLSGEEAA